MCISSRLATLAFLVALGVTGCRAGGGPQAVTLPPVEAPFAAPLERTVVDWEEYTGKVMAIESVNIMARADGYLSDIRFKPGQFVHKNDILFVIDRRPYETALDNAKAMLAQAEARVKRLSKDHARMSRLVSTGAGTSEDFDKVDGDLAEAKATELANRAMVQQATLNLSFTEVRAPVDGRVGRPLVTVGNLVQGSIPSSATVLTDLVSVDEVYVYFEAPERDVLRYRRTMLGDKAEADVPIEVEIGLFDEVGYPHKGVIDFVHERVDPGTGTQTFRARVKNPNGRLFAEGMFARVKVAFSKPYQTLAVADRAVVTVQGDKFLYVINASDTVEERLVELGRLISPGLRQVKKGLQPGDRVAVSNLQRMMPGAKVAPVAAPMPLPPNS
jgi:RND family efflux transporter MFP subunit